MMKSELYDESALYEFHHAQKVSPYDENEGKKGKIGRSMMKIAKGAQTSEKSVTG